MKKLFVFLLFFITITLVSCDGISGSSVSGIFGKQLKTTDVKRIADVKIEANYVTCYITPSGFEYDELIEDGFSYMEITISYDLSYEKTYTGWDIFYAGKPKYDLSIEDESEMGLHLTGLETSDSVKRKSHTYSAQLINLIDNRIILKLGSINIQNAIYFTDISVNYQCYK